MLAISERQRIVLLDAQSWESLTEIELEERVHHSSLALAADKSLLAFASTHSHDISIFDLPTGEFQGTLQGHTSGVTSVCISPGGDFLASTSHDETLKIWKLLE
jgi:WD40 repeat protein